jgi:T4-like virus Myoviridae tail sheath stabiliser
MLGNSPFYHQLTRKAVVLFGRLFDDITLVRKNDQTGSETNRFLVPIVYAPKEKMVTRIFSDPDLLRQIQVLLPRMSFEITGITYDATRKQNSLLRAAKSNTSTHVTASYMGVPYDINFQLNIYARNIDDGTQIIEQILPFFNPDFTVSTNMIPDLGALKDVPIILNNISNDIQYEGDFDSIRYVNWTLNFTMKMYYYGPISYPKIIRTVYANIWNDPSLQSGYITRINTSNANGVFKVNDTVYQGSNYQTATATGIVVSYNETLNQLVVGATQGRFLVNNNIHAVSTNGVCTLESFYAKPLKLVEIEITPDPVTAQPTDDYGYDINITEWPATE